MTDEPKKPLTLTIPINFMWSKVIPDPRPYKPGKPVLMPIDVVVVIDVPLAGVYVYNAFEILEAQLTSGNSKVPSPLLTPKGMQFCVSTLEDAMTQRATSIDDFDKVEWDEK